MTLTLQVQFARANALAGYKAKTLDDIAGVCLPPDPRSIERY